MERYFIIDKFNTWYDWKCVVTAKDIPEPEPKTNYVEIDGMSGSLDLSEALTGEATYQDRTLKASFWTCEGSYMERGRRLRDIRAALHGKKVKIVEPDDPDHYFYGRIKIKGCNNIIPYAEFDIEAVCEPWRYAIEESSRRIDVNSSDAVEIVINNNGVKTLSPVVTVTGTVYVIVGGIKTELSNGNYKLSNFKLYQGANVIGVSGNGSVTFVYREAEL